MPRRLKGLQVNRIALVDRGANQHADTVLWKRDDVVKADTMVCPECGATIPADSTTCPECGATITAPQKANPDTADVHLTQGMPQSPQAMIGHLNSAHDVTPRANPFAAHDAAHRDQKFASGKEHTHTEKRDYSTEQRVEMAKDGRALPVKNADGDIVDGRYPIGNRADLENAIQAFGRGGPTDKAAIQAHITKNARRLGATDLLPDGWTGKSDTSLSAVTIKSEDGTDLTIAPNLAMTGNALNTASTTTTPVYAVWRHATTGNTTSTEKIGRKISSRRLRELKESRAAIDRVIAEAEVADESSRKEARMPDDTQDTLSDETRGSLPEEAQKYVVSLEADIEKMKADLAKAAKDAESDTEDVTKGMSDEVRKAYERQQAELNEVRKALETETEQREVAEVSKRLGTAREAGVNPDEWAPSIRKLEKSDPDFAAKVEQTLNAAAQRVREGALFSVLGKGGSALTEGEDRVNQAASEIAKSEGISHEDAVAKFLETPEGKRAYAEAQRGGER